MLVRGLESLWWYAWIHFAIGGLHWISTYFRLLSVLKADHIPPLWLLQLVEMSREQEISVAFPIRQDIKRQWHHLRNEGLQTERSGREAHGSTCLLWWRDNYCFGSIWCQYTGRSGVQSEQYVFLCQLKMLQWKILRSLGALEDATIVFISEICI